MTDERLNLTSASSALADSLCPARFLRQRGLPETKNPEAIAGTRMHEAYAADSTDGLTDPDERKTVEMALERDKQIIESWAALVNANPDTVERWITEKRLWSYFNKWPEEAASWAADDKCHSGQPDKVWRCRDFYLELHFLVSDFKSGRDAVEKDSHQLRDIAALIEENIMAAQSVTVCINQPWAPGKPELIHYTHADMMVAHDEMVRRVMRSHDPKAPAIPGEVQCKYCRALGTSRCPESIQLIPAPVVAVEGKLKRGQAQAIARKLTLEDQAAIFKKWGMADKVFKAIEAELKLTAPEALASVGLCMEDGTGRRSITNTVELWNRLAKLGVSQQQFLACVNVGLGKVTEVVQSVTGIKGAKELEAKMDELLEGIVDKKETAKSLVEIKEGK